MNIFRSLLGWIGNLALLIPSLILIIAQWAPKSILPYSDFIPSDALFQYAIYGAIALAILVPLSLFKTYNNEEGKFTFFSWVKYIVFFILSVVLGAVLGYAGTIKGGYILGNTVMKENLTDNNPLALTLEEKVHNTVRSRYAYCEYELNTAMGTNDIQFYEKFFIPTDLCVNETIYNDAAAGENIVLLGNGNDQLGFFFESLLTQKDIEKIKKQNAEKNPEPINPEPINPENSSENPSENSSDENEENTTEEK